MLPRTPYASRLPSLLKTLTGGALLLGLAQAHAQLTFIEWNTAGNSFVWLTDSNWVGGEHPNDPSHVAWFGANAYAPDTFDYPESGFTRSASTLTIQMNTAAGLREAAAIVISPLNTVDRRVRNNGANSVGELRLYGANIVIGEQVFENLLIGNFSEDNQFRWYQSARTQPNDLRFMNSGVIHVENMHAMVRITSRIYEPDGVPVSLTKTGAGILNLGVDHGSGNSDDPDPRFHPRLDVDRNQITGDMIVKEGFVMNTYSGTVLDEATGEFNSPYGLGNLVLQGGSIISSTTGARTVYNNVVLDGHVNFGTTIELLAPGHSVNGNNTIRDDLGHFTTLASDSSITLYNTVTWIQNVIGPYSLTKHGDGLLRISGLFDIDSLRIDAGPAFFFGDEFTERRITGTATIGSGALFGGDGTVDGALSIEAGGTLEPSYSTTGGQLAVGSLTLDSGSFAHFTITPVLPPAEQEALETTPIVASGAVSLGGAELSLALADPLTDPVVLIDNRSGTAVTGQFNFNGAPLAEGAVISLFSGDVAITYNFSEGDYSQSVALIPPGVGPGTGYDAWREARYGNTSDPAGAPTAQPAGQPVANLLFYALGLDLAPDAATGLPQATTGEPSITFLRRADLEANLTVQGTDGSPAGAWTDLTTLTAGSSSWTGTATVTEEPAGAGLIRVTVTDTAGSATGVRLLRIQSSLP